jgi:protein fantom
MDFLERADETHLINHDNVKALKVEINKLRHENKDFAAELEKA